jgi:hypothetical protein
VVNSQVYGCYAFVYFVSKLLIAFTSRCFELILTLD